MSGTHTPILVAEDDPASLHLIEHTLKHLGYPVSLASNGREAWTLFQNSPFRIVISDWHMPEMDGLKLCENIRSQNTKTYSYFILLTAEQQNTANLEKAIKAGVDDFLTKSMDRFLLRTRLHVAERILGFTREIGELKTLMPICSYCKKIRKDEKYWEQIEAYFQREAGTKFSHGICPDCFEKHVRPEINSLS